MTKRVFGLFGCLFFIQAIIAQTINVEGIVIDETGESVVGAVVRQKGNQQGVLTDINGKFTMNNVKAKTRLVVSFAGMKTVEEEARPKMHITLIPEISDLDEVVVTAFGEQKRASFTGSASVLDSKKIEMKQVTNVLSSLQGEAAGVQMLNNSGSPTSVPTIRIRGFSSINAGKDPLIIVDGSPYDGGWNNLNPNDVASVTVLKDAASNALYGARGSNGVIMITTKKAKAGEAVVTLDAKWGTNRRIERNYDLIRDPGQYYETYYRALYNYQVNEKGVSPYKAHMTVNNVLGGNANEGGLGYICYTVPDGEYLIGENGRLNPHATLGNRVYHNGQVYTIYPDSWKDEAFRTGMRQEYNLNITGGNERAQFYAALGYLSNEGIAHNSEFERYTGRLKADYQAKDWLKIGGNVNFTHNNAHTLSNSDNEIFELVNNVAPIYPVYIRDAYGNLMTDANGIMYDYGDGAVWGVNRPVIPLSNPIQSDNLNTELSTTNMFSANGYADITFMEGLKATINGTVTSYNTRYTSTAQPFYGQVTYPTGYISKGQAETYSYNFQQLLNYTKDFGKNHIELMIGHEYYRKKYEYVWGARTGMASYFGNQNLSGAIKIDNTNDSSTDYNNEGFFFRGQYDFGQRYFASVSFRRDASSNFHPDHCWGNFYSVGAAWIMTKESWFKPKWWIQSLKLKASFGQQGNDDIGSYKYTDTYTIENNNDQLAFNLSTKGNPDITWETNNNFNVGVEFELLKSRLRGSVEYFNRKTTDMLCFVQAPYSAGYFGSYDNIGNMVNKGIEVDLNGDIIRTKKLTWSMNMNITHYKNEVTKLADEIKNDAPYGGYYGYISGDKIYAEGLPMYTWYLQRYAGVSEEGKSLWYYTAKDGSLQTTDVYGNADFYICGDSHPDFYGGFGTTLSYAGFDLSVTFSYSVGGKAYDYLYASYMSSPNGTFNGAALHKDILNAWSLDNPNSDIPRWQYNDVNQSAMSDRFLTDASYLTFQNINVGYNLPKKWINRLKLSGVRVYFAGDNLCYWSKRKGFDPRGSFTGETSTTAYSPSRCLSGGINIRF